MLGNLYAFVVFNQVVYEFMLTHFSVPWLYVFGAVAQLS